MILVIMLIMFFFCDVNGDALDDGVAYYPSQKSGNLSVALSDGVKLITPTNGPI